MAGLISNLMLFPLFKRMFNFRYSGLEKISKKENYIFAMNHQSGLDFLLALSILVPYTKRHLSIILDQRFYNFPLLKPIFKRWQAIPINHLDDKEKRKALFAAKKALKKGNNVLIFPEGDLIGGAIGSPIRAFTGVTQLAIMSKKRIIPVGIKGSYHAWKFPIAPAKRHCRLYKKESIEYRPKGRWIWLNDLYNFFELNFKHPVRMNFGKAFDLGKYYKLDLRKYNEENKKKLRIVTTQLMMQIAQLAGQKYRYDC